MYHSFGLDLRSQLILQNEYTLSFCPFMFWLLHIARNDLKLLSNNCVRSEKNFVPWKRKCLSNVRVGFMWSDHVHVTLKHKS